MPPHQLSRQNASPGNIPLELWKGQTAGLERSVASTQLCRTELMSYLQELVSGQMKYPQLNVMSIVLTFTRLD